MLTCCFYGAQCNNMHLHDSGRVLVYLLLQQDAYGAVDWLSNSTIHDGALPAGTVLNVSVAPGNTSFIEFGHL